LNSDLINCFEQLNSLFCSTIEIILIVQNVPNFKILEEILGNPLLKSKCIEVSSTQKQIFNLTSKYFSFFIQAQIDKLYDFNLIANGQMFLLSFELFYCISDKFLETQKSCSEFQCYIPPELFQFFLQFMDLFKNGQINFDEEQLPSLIFLIDIFGLQCLNRFIPSNIHSPTNLDETLNILSKPFFIIMKYNFMSQLQIYFKIFHKYLLINFICFIILH
jgi:hypothetical protein